MSKKKNNLNYIPASAKTAAQKKEEAKQSKRENLSPEMRAKLLKKRAWTLSVISLCFVLVLTLSILFASYTPTYYNEKTNKAPGSDVVSGIIANEEFGLSTLLYNNSVSTLLQQPYLPSDWTLSETVATTAVSGIISRDESTKSKVQSDLKAVGITDTDDINAILANTDATAVKDDKNVLLMYNKTSANTRAYSNSFSVAANSYLKVTVKVRADIADGEGAYIALKTSASDSKEAEVIFTGIKDADWTEYTFFVEGSKTSSKTLYLFVGLGTSDSKVQGWAEFDYAKAQTVKKVDYIKTVNESTSATIKTKSYVNDINETNLFASKFGASNVIDGVVPEIGVSNPEYELPFYNASNLEVYKLSNPASSSVNSVFMKLTNKLTVNKSVTSSYYRLSFWAKTTDIELETGAFFYARLYKEDGTTEFASINSVVTPTGNSDVNSGWKEFSFLFKPDNNLTYDAEIVFALGELRYADGNYAPVITDKKTTGNLYVTEFELKEIYPSEYDSASAGSNIAKVALASTTSTGLITNGSFNSPIANASNNNTLTAFDPNGWNIVVPRANTTDGIKYAPHSKDNVIFGIVGKSTVDVADYLGTSYADYFGHTGDDHVLAVKTKSATAIGFVSNSFTIPANSTYAVSVLVKASANNVANVYLTGDVAQTFKVAGIDADKYYQFREFDNNGYIKYNFVIKTGDIAKNVALELWVGDKDVDYANNAWDTTGFAPADTIVAFDEACADSITDKQFNDLVNAKEGNNNVFAKTETTKDDVVTDVKYTTAKQNIMVTDFGYADETGAIETDDDVTEEEKEEIVAPIDWLLFSSLILSVAVIIFLIAVICKKFKKAQKQTVEVVEDPDYKN